MLLTELGKAVAIIRALPKSLYLNLRYFPLPVAMRCPILVSHRTRLVLLGGKLQLQEPRFGSVRFGLASNSLFPDDGVAPIWSVAGYVHLGRRIRLGPSSKLVCEDGARLEVGDRFEANAGFALYCRNKVRVGQNVLASWNTTVMDSDWHHITNLEGHIQNAPGYVEIGDHVWLGAEVMVLKNSHIPANSVVAARTTYYGEFTEQNLLIGGNPPRVLKREIDWCT